MHYTLMMLAAATIGLLVAMLITLVRAIAGPSLYDRVLAVNSVGTGSTSNSTRSRTW